MYRIDPGGLRRVFFASNNAATNTARQWGLLTALLLLTALVYWPGLGGGLLFDDRANLEPLRLWQAGDIGWRQVVLDNNSGPLGRPVAMLSLLLNVAISGDGVWGLKLGNLLLHLLTGVVLWMLLLRLATRDCCMAVSMEVGMADSKVRHSLWLALAVTAVWLLHPLLVSTVLYVVQRMAMLSALFMLLAMLAYVHGRQQVNNGHIRSGMLWLFVVVPLLTALATFSKENGLLAPYLCLVLEWVYFIPASGEHRPLAVRWFIGLAAGLALLAAMLVLLLAPELVFSGYANRPFTVMQRLLTEGRVLFDYIGNILLPSGPHLSLFRDDYVISTDLLTPITTLFAWLGWLLLIGLAVAGRRRIPGFTAGIGIFLVGHAMESGLFPLLIYFEHRNYLPAIGILWALAALLLTGWRRLAAHIDNPRLLVGIGLSALLAVLALATHARARIWHSSELMLEQSLRYYPDSRHLRMELASVEMNKPFPDVAAAKRHIKHLLTLERTSTQFIGGVDLLMLDCQTRQQTTETDVVRAFSIQPDTIEADVLHAVEVLANTIQNQACANLPPTRLADGLVQVLDQSALPPDGLTIWRLRFLAAKLYAADSNLVSAFKQAEQAWPASGADLPVGMLLANLQINLGLYDRAEKLLDEIDQRMAETDQEGQKLLSDYRQELNKRFAESIFPSN